MKGVGVRAQLTEKPLTTFFGLFFLALNLFYSFTEKVQWFILTKTTIFQVPQRVQHFRGEGGSKMLISIDTNKR